MDTPAPAHDDTPGAAPAAHAAAADASSQAVHAPPQAVSDALGAMSGISAGPAGDSNSQPRLSLLFRQTGTNVRSAPKQSVVGDDADKKGSTFSVYMATTETMWGVIIFLRFSEVLSYAGLVLTLGTIWMSAALVAMVGTASCAIATNGFIPYGGMYHILTKNIGHAMGGSIGLLYYMGLVCLSATEIRGFSQAIEAVLQMEGVTAPELGGSYWFYTLIALAAFVIVCTVGRNHLLNEGIGILVLVAVMASFAATIIGGFATSGGWAVNTYRGVVGLSTSALSDNAWPHWGGDWDFRKVLTFILPCFVGIFTGPNRASTLRNPYRSIPIGTFGAILTSALLYSMLMIIMAATTTRLVLRENLSMRYIAWPSKYVVVAGMLLVGIGAAMQLQSTAPGLLRAMAKDAIIPQIKRLHLHRPGRTELVSMCIALPFVLIQDLDQLATVVTLVFLLCYGFTSLACLALQLLKLPGWRPNFRYHYWIFSLIAFVFCLAAMFAIQWIAALLMVVAGFGIAMAIHILNADATWGSGMRAIHANLALSSLLTLEGSELKTGGRGSWRPQVLLLSDITPEFQLRHPRLLALVHQMRKSRGLTVVGAVVPSDGRTLSECGEDIDLARAGLRAAVAAEGMKAFVDIIFAPSAALGHSMLIQQSGLGPLRPNTVLVAWPDGWREDPALAARLVSIVEETQVSGKALVVARGVDLLPIASERLTGTIDVWWIVHEGGMLLLLGFLLTRHRVWRKCRLRLFVVAEFEDNSVAIEGALKILLANLRISAEVTVVEMEANDFQPFMQEWTVRLERRQEMRKGAFPDDLEDLATMVFHQRESMPREHVEDSTDRLREEASEGGVAKPPSSTDAADVNAPSPAPRHSQTSSGGPSAARHSHVSQASAAGVQGDIPLVDMARASSGAGSEGTRDDEVRMSGGSSVPPAEQTTEATAPEDHPEAPPQPERAPSPRSHEHTAIHMSRFVVSSATATPRASTATRGSSPATDEAPRRASRVTTVCDGPMPTLEDKSEGLRRRARIALPDELADSAASSNVFGKASTAGSDGVGRTRKRTLAAVRLRQAVEALSSQAALVIMNMPLPDEGARDDPAMYFELLDGLTEKPPRVLLVLSSGQQVVSEFVE